MRNGAGTRDAAHRAPLYCTPSRSHRENGGTSALLSTRQVRDRGRLEPTPYVGVHGCNARPRNLRARRRCASDSGMSQSTHSRRIAPMSRSQMPFAATPAFPHLSLPVLPWHFRTSTARTPLNLLPGRSEEHTSELQSPMYL